MGLSKTLKSNARYALEGNWGRAIAVLLIGMLPVFLINILEFGMRAFTGIPEFIDYSMTPGIAFDDMANVALASTVISVLMLILILLIITPLEMGTVRWFYGRSGGEDVGVMSVFHYFETGRDYFKAIWMNVQIAVRMFFWVMLLSIPMIAGVTFYALMPESIAYELSDPVLLLGGLLLMVWAVITALFTILIGLRYFLAPYLLAAHPELKARQAIKRSVKLVKGHKGSLFVFMLSFIGWWLLGLLLIPLFYTMPYTNASYAMYARYLIQLGEAGDDPTANDTREYTYRPDIDRYMEQQTENTSTQDTCSLPIEQPYSPTQEDHDNQL